MNANRNTPRRGLLVLMCVGMFLVQLDVTIVNVSLLPIQNALGGGVAAAQWVVGGYIVALSAALIPGGILADRVGTKASTLIGLASFTATSAAAGLSPSMEALIAARVGQGIAAALLLPSTLAVINQLFTESADKARAMGLWAGFSALALPAGPLLGGALCNAGHWRAIFLLNVPIALAALALCSILLPQAPSSGKAPPANWINLLLIATCLSTLVLATTLIGEGRYVLTATAVAVFFLSMVIISRREATLADPAIPHDLRRNVDFRRATVISFAMNLVGIGLIFTMSLYFEGIEHSSPLHAGMRLLPLFIPLALGAPLTGKLVARVGPRLPMAAGLLTGAFGCAVLALFATQRDQMAIIIALIAIGTGMGLLTPAVVAYAMQASPVQLSGLASSINNAARQAGGALGIAIFGTLTGSVHGDPQSFLAGTRNCALVSVALWIACAALLLTTSRTTAPMGNHPSNRLNRRQTREQ